MKFLGDFKGKVCAIQLKSVTLQDTGTWYCKIEKWISYQQILGVAPTISKAMSINVREKFKIIEMFPKTRLRLKEGDSIVLKCVGNYKLDKCKFEHFDKFCQFEFLTNSTTATMIKSCSEHFNGRVEFIGNYENNKCAIKIKYAEIQDGGDWSCQLNSKDLKNGGNEEFQSTSVKFYINVNEKFRFTEIKPKHHLIVHKGEKVTFSCASNQYFEKCTFKHHDKKCEMSWDGFFEKEILDCDDFKKARIFGNPKNKTCEINLKSISENDTGIWSCQLKLFHGYKQTSGLIIEGKILIEMAHDNIKDSTMINIIVTIISCVCFIATIITILCLNFRPCIPKLPEEKFQSEGVTEDNVEL